MSDDLDLKGRLLLDTSDLEAAVGRASKAGSKIGSAVGSAFGGLAASGIAGGVAAVKNFAGGAVDAFARVEDATGAAGVQFGKALPQVEAFAASAAKNFGISKGAALDAQNTFGTLGKAAGLQGTPLASFSGKLSGLAGDLASFKGTSTEQAIEAVGAALRGESEPIRAYGVLINDAAVQSEALALGLVKPVVNADKLRAAQLRVVVATSALSKATKEHGKGSIEAQKAQGALASAQTAVKTATEGTTGPLSLANKTLAVQSLILKQTKDAQGDYARTSSSTANVQKTLAAETENAQAALGKKLAPAVTKVRQAFLKLIQGSSGLIDTLGQVISGFGAVAGALPTPVLKALAVVVGTVAAAIVLQTAATLVASAATGAWGKVTGLFRVTKNLETGAVVRGTVARLAHNVATIAAKAATIAWGIATKAAAVGQILLNAALRANPIGLVVTAIAALVAGFILAYKNSQTFRNILAGVFTFLKRPIDIFLASIQAVFSALGHVPGFGWAKDAAEKVKGLRHTLDGVADSIRNIPARKQVIIDVQTHQTSLRNLERSLGVGGARAVGGPVTAGTPYLVGEKGPELFTPSASGRIKTARDTAAGGSGLNIGTIVINEAGKTANETLPRTLRNLAWTLGLAT